jgi:hypothetical protein
MYVHALFGLLYDGLTWRGLIPMFIAISKLNFKHTYLKLFVKDNFLRLMFAYTTSDVYLTLRL